MMNMNNFILLLAVCFMYIVIVGVGMYAILCDNMVLRLCAVAVVIIISVFGAYYLAKNSDKED